jgi:GntR family transcriptional regulator, transcriptional repressor for pyruvate dehydrogenase complex
VSTEAATTIGTMRRQPEQLPSAPAAQRRRPQPQHVAEMVASALRDDILGEEISVLPRLEDLTRQFNVGRPAIREAMRILGTEGLVLQSQSAELGDVAAALRQLEPLCAAMCAARPDRAQSVVPVLREAVREQAEAIGDGPRTREVINRFHRGLITGCGNQTLVLVVGALEVVWAGHASAVYDRAEFDEPDIAKWKTSVRHHERIVASIENGDAGVTTMVAKHIEATQAYMSSIDDSRRVTAAATAAVIG